MTLEYKISDQRGQVVITLDQHRLIIHGPDGLLRLVHQHIIHGLETWDESELTP